MTSEPPHAGRAELARDTLGDAAFDTAAEQGKRMSIDAAVAFALDQAEPAAAPRRPSPVGSAELTKRELEVAELVARGLSNKEIAQTLVLSTRTAEGHVARLLDKLGFESRARVAAWVAERRARGQ